MKVSGYCGWAAFSFGEKNKDQNNAWKPYCVYEMFM